MRQFEIPLKNEKIKSYKASLVVMIFLNVLAFLFFAYTAKNSSIKNSCLFAATATAVFMAFDFIVKKRDRLNFRSAAVIIIIVSYFRLDYYLLAVVVFLISVLYFIAIQPPKVLVSEKNLSYGSFVNRKISWDQLNNIILKDGILTIDFKNNKLIQQHVDPALLEVNEQEFNDFCIKQLTIDY